MFYAAAQTIARGRTAGWLSAVGFHVGGYVHISTAAFGLAVLLETVPTLYTIMKLAGAIYLIWLGTRLFMSPKTVVVSLAAVGEKPNDHAIRDGAVVEVLNPKTALFYLAFLPQFTEASASLPIWARILILGTIVNFIFSATDVFCILLSERVTRRLAASQWANRLAQRIGGTILIGLGINLAVARQ